MELLGIQLIGMIFGIGFLYLTFINRKKNELTEGESLVWMLVGIATIVISIFPNILNFIVKNVLSVSRTLDFLIIVSIMGMFGILFYVFLITKKTQNKLERLVREMAIKNAEKKLKK
jgi:hypothetical protein